MQSLQELIQHREVSKGSERTDILRSIYDIYLKDRNGRRKDNWKRYCIFCREKKMENSKNSQKLFKKSKMFIKESSSRNMAIKLSHIPTKDLYYIKSVAQDKLNRKESVGGFILGSIKIKLCG